MKMYYVLCVFVWRFNLTKNITEMRRNENGQNGWIFGFFGFVCIIPTSHFRKEIHEGTAPRLDYPGCILLIGIEQMIFFSEVCELVIG